MIRGILFFGAFVGVIMTPWLFWICSFIYTLQYRAYELVALALFSDFIWLSGGIPYTTLCMIVLVLGTEPLRKEFLT